MRPGAVYIGGVKLGEVEDVTFYEAEPDRYAWTRETVTIEATCTLQPKDAAKLWADIGRMCATMKTHRRKRQLKKRAKRARRRMRR